MSRVGKKPVTLPQGVQANIDATSISLQGPKGKLTLPLRNGVQVAKDKDHLVVSCSGSEAVQRSTFGTTRAILNNMVIGVTKGFKKSLELQGVGYNVTVQGQNIKLVVGLSHEVKITLPKEIKATAEKTTLHLESADRELLGTIAAGIRKVRKPEPYLGKGIRYSDEKVRRKAGKAGKKA